MRSQLCPCCTHLAALVVLCLSAAVARPAVGQCQYSLTVIEGPNCPFWPAATTAVSLNDVGQVVGYHSQCSSSEDEGFVWSSDAGLVTLPRPAGSIGARASDINDSGQIVGRVTMNDNNYRAALWQDGMVQVLGTLPGGNASAASQINESGQVVGYWQNTVQGPIRGFLWQNGEFLDLGPELESGYSIANGINDQAAVCGWYGDNWLQDGQPYVWQGGEVTALPNGDGVTIANALNHFGLLVGQATVPLDRYPYVLRRAMLIQERAAVPLDTLGPHQLESTAYDVNDSGQVVGRSFHEGILLDAGAGVLWQNHVPLDLNELVADSRSTMHLKTARAINEAGVITGSANDAELHVFGYLLTPIDPPQGDVGGDCRVDLSDVHAVIEHWGVGGSPADVNHDGSVNVDDLVCVLLNWTS